VDEDKIEEEARYDGKWVLTTNMDLPSAEVALKYKQLWMVEDVFRSMKSLLDTRPIYHKCDETIRGHVFCSFLALLLRKELEDRFVRKEWKLEWADVIRDLGNIVEMEVAISGKGYVFRGQTPVWRARSFKPVASPCHHAARMLNDLQFGADGEKPCHYAVPKPQHADNQSLPKLWCRR